MQCAGYPFGGHAWLVPAQSSAEHATIYRILRQSEGFLGGMVVQGMSPVLYMVLLGLVVGTGYVGCAFEWPRPIDFGLHCLRFMSF